jgi:hypothetical protein
MKAIYAAPSVKNFLMYLSKNIFLLKGVMVAWLVRFKKLGRRHVKGKKKTSPLSVHHE